MELASANRPSNNPFWVCSNPIGPFLQRLGQWRDGQIGILGRLA
jgi:hypothetical protein